MDPLSSLHPFRSIRASRPRVQTTVQLTKLPSKSTVTTHRCHRAYHSTHEDRREFAAARAAWGIEGRWDTLQHRARQEILSDLFPDLGESTYENWDFKQGDVLMAFLNQRILAAPDETRHIWKLDGPNDETPSMAWLYMAHVGPSDLGPPRSPALRKDLPTPEPRRVHGPPEWMLT